MIVEVRERTIDGTILRRLEEVDLMKLKCTICLIKHGVAVKTDQLFLVTYNGSECLACLSCKEQITGGKPHENANSDDNA